MKWDKPSANWSRRRSFASSLWFRLFPCPKFDPCAISILQLVCGEVFFVHIYLRNRPLLHMSHGFPQVRGKQCTRPRYRGTPSLGKLLWSRVSFVFLRFPTQFPAFSSVFLCIFLRFPAVSYSFLRCPPISRSRIDSDSRCSPSSGPMRWTRGR